MPPPMKRRIATPKVCNTSSSTDKSSWMKDASPLHAPAKSCEAQDLAGRPSARVRHAIAVAEHGLLEHHRLTCTWCAARTNDGKSWQRGPSLQRSQPADDAFLVGQPIDDLGVLA